MEVIVNWWAIIVCTIVAMVIGAVWYSPMLFADSWMKLIGKKASDINMKAAQQGYVAAVLLNLLSAYILTHFVRYAGATTAMEGAMTGLWVWLGFVFTSSAMSYIFEQRPSKLFWINTVMPLISLVISGAILAVWR